MGNGVSQSDDLQLRRLYALQSYAIDSGDAEGWADSFTEDGEFSSPTYPQPAKGRTALTEFARKFYSQSPTRQYRHWLGNLWFEYLGNNHIISNGYSLIVATDSGGTPQLLRSTPFKDDVVRENGHWRIKRRIGRPDPPARVEAPATQERKDLEHINQLPH